MKWYKQRRDAGENVTEVGDMTRKMIGHDAEGTVTFKGAECWGILRFMLDELHRFNVRPRYVLAGRYMERLLSLWRAAAWRLTPVEINKSWQYFHGFLACMEGDTSIDIPKKHQFMHMMRRLPFAGNPMYFSCWMEEALNKNLKRASRLISQQTFELTVLNSMCRLLASGRYDSLPF